MTISGCYIYIYIYIHTDYDSVCLTEMYGCVDYAQHIRADFLFIFGLFHTERYSRWFTVDVLISVGGHALLILCLVCTDILEGGVCFSWHARGEWRGRWLFLITLYNSLYWNLCMVLMVVPLPGLARRSVYLYRLAGERIWILWRLYDRPYLINNIRVYCRIMLWNRRELWTRTDELRA